MSNIHNSRVPDALQCVSVAAQSRDPEGHSRSKNGPRLCSAALRAALRPGHEASERQPQYRPRSL